MSLRSLLRDESGASAIEYGLIAALISIAIIGTTAFLGGGVSGVFNHVGTQITSAATN